MSPAEIVTFPETVRDTNPLETFTPVPDELKT